MASNRIEYNGAMPALLRPTRGRTPTQQQIRPLAAVSETPHRSKSKRNTHTNSTKHCLDVFDRLNRTKEGRRNMKDLDHKLLLHDLASRDVFPWPKTLMEVFDSNFTAKVHKLSCLAFPFLTPFINARCTPIIGPSQECQVF